MIMHIMTRKMASSVLSWLIVDSAGIVVRYYRLA